MNLNQLYYFQKVAQLQHYHQAAKELNISQPSLSRSIANLEEELGVSLFQKNGRNIELTKYGSIFLEHVNRIIEEIKIASLEDYLWQPNQYDEEEIFNLTKILKLVDNDYCDIQLSKAYIHWYDKYDFERIEIFMVTILRHFASIEEFEEEEDFDKDSLERIFDHLLESHNHFIYVFK